MNVALIGAGRIGNVRARVIVERRSEKIVRIADPHFAAAQELAARCGATAMEDWRQAISDPDVDIVVVATPTILHAEIASAALAKGKHVLCEKPLARNVEEAAGILQKAHAAGKILKTGFNYRHMPHVRKAKELIDGGALGKLSFMRCHFGHGGRVGFDQEWHTDPTLSGGGVLLEHGIHVMDLIRHLLGEPARVVGQRSTFYWKLREIEDNCYCLFETETGQIAQIHISWTQWVNAFHMEIFGQDGFLRLEGRDGHYGPPVITWAKRNADHSRPREEKIAYEPGEDWVEEWSEFIAAVQGGREPLGSGLDGLRALRMIEATYESAATDRWVSIPADRKEQA